jgi:hypothetical protein
VALGSNVGGDAAHERGAATETRRTGLDVDDRSVMADVLHVYVLVCVVLQTTEEAGRCDRSDGARSEKTDHLLRRRID